MGVMLGMESRGHTELVKVTTLHIRVSLVSYFYFSSVCFVL